MALALASAGAAALGLGEIVVKSGPGQPFLAEIPIIAAEPGEIESAQARLASPETFARVGLQPPQGLVGNLQFQVTRNAHGHAVVRVTSAAPVDLPALSFLIEVDWGRGRLVREYSALIDAPRVAAAQPIIETPMALPADTIPRPAPAQAATVAASPQPATPASPQAAPRPVTPAAEPPVSAAVSDGAQITVAPGQTLYSIASELQAGTDASVPQWMMGLLRANPQAFIGDNINRLKAGAVLQAPARAELQAVNAAQAQALVREHVARWRQASAPLPQPADPGTGTRPVAATPGAPSAPVATQSDARLQIAPAVASGTERTAVQSGAGADGGGDMVTTEQLRQAREDLATRDMEMQELRARVAELERLQQQQMQLIALKDDDLAAAQQRLAQQQSQSTDTALPVWIWALLAALVAAVVLAWLLGQRRKPSPFSTRTAVDRAALAAAMPAAPAAAAGATRPPDAERPGAAAPPPAAVPPFAHPPAAVPAPAWTAGSTAPSTAPSAAPSTGSAPLPGPTWHRGDAASRIAPLNPAPAGRERLELAVAYLDLGDVETARDLLHEVVEAGDETLRAEAARLLRDIG